MRTSKAAIDPLWQCLCPSWTQSSLVRASRILQRPKAPTLQCQKVAAPAPQISSTRHYNNGPNQARMEASIWHYGNKTPYKPGQTGRRPDNFAQDDTSTLYGRLRSAAVNGETRRCRKIVEFLVKERKERPNIQLYNALILSNVSHDQGAAWRVSELLDEMAADGIQPDSGSCHAALKVLAVHLDHLLRADILDYMQKRWFQLSENGAHDVAAAMLREGLFEQALNQIDEMKGRMQIDAWLWDMAVYTLCDAGEVDEAYRIMRSRFDSGEMNTSRSAWYYLLDKGSEARHYEATTLAWSSQVNQGYLNPATGVCLNVLTTAAKSGDAVLGTEVFGHLSKRGTTFQPIHYELLISTYLSTSPPDLKRAISILTIMPLEKLEPTIAETRSLYLYLKDKPALIKEAFAMLRELHEQDRTIPIAVLNLLIECHVEQRDLAEAMKIYKLIHTFAPIGKGAQKSYANIETFNLLLKGCRLAHPPDHDQASFLVSELLALRVVPTALTYDRLILVFLEAGNAALLSEAGRAKGLELIDWAFRHFVDMQPLGWMPRFGTLERLAVSLADVGDTRCWDILQASEDGRDLIEGYAEKSGYLRTNVEKAWERYEDEKSSGVAIVAPAS